MAITELAGENHLDPARGDSEESPMGKIEQTIKSGIGAGEGVGDSADVGLPFRCASWRRVRCGVG